MDFVHGLKYLLPAMLCRQIEVNARSVLWLSMVLIRLKCFEEPFFMVLEERLCLVSSCSQPARRVYSMW